MNQLKQLTMKPGALQEVLEHPCLPRGSNSTELLIGDADAQADAAAAGANALPPLSATWHGKGQYDAWDRYFTRILYRFSICLYHF